MQLAAILFAVAAVGGVVLATMHFKGLPRSLPLAVVHLLAATAGLVRLLLAVRDDPSVMLANVALGVMVVVALGEFYSRRLVC
jgi:hypothetical protein